MKKDGDLREVLRTMFYSREFWSPEAYRARVKTPLEFVASALRATNAQISDPMPLVNQLNRMGMPLYGMQPPTGYSTKADVWVNSAALLDRMNFGLALATNRLPGTHFDLARLTRRQGRCLQASARAIPTRCSCNWRRPCLQVMFPSRRMRPSSRRSRAPPALAADDRGRANGCAVECHRRIAVRVAGISAESERQAFRPAKRKRFIEAVWVSHDEHF